jgi:hypothetical protein
MTKRKLHQARRLFIRMYARIQVLTYTMQAARIQVLTYTMQATCVYIMLIMRVACLT